MVSPTRLYHGQPAGEESKQNLALHHNNTTVDRDYERRPTNQSLANRSASPTNPARVIHPLDDLKCCLKNFTIRNVLCRAEL